MEQMTEEQLEKILSEMPKLQRSRNAEISFFESLEASARKTEEPSAGFWRIPRFAFAGAFAALIIAAFGGVALSYNSGVTRGHFLYSVKQTAERAELALAASASS